MNRPDVHAAFEIREVDDADLDAYYDIRSQAFGRPEAERARADAREALHGRAQPLRVDRQLAGEGEGVVVAGGRRHERRPYIRGSLYAAATCSSVRSRPSSLAR